MEFARNVKYHLDGEMIFDNTAINSEIVACLKKLRSRTLITLLSPVTYCC
jgi:hypothetical protein